MDLVGSYRCDCVTGYSGSNCETGNLPSLHDKRFNEIVKNGKMRSCIQFIGLTYFSLVYTKVIIIKLLS